MASKSRSRTFGDVSITTSSVVASATSTVSVVISCIVVLSVEASESISTSPPEAKFILLCAELLPAIPSLTSTTKLSMTPSFSTERSTDVYSLYTLYGLYTSESTAHITNSVVAYTRAVPAAPMRFTHHLLLSNAINVHMHTIIMSTGTARRITSTICAFILDMTVSALSTA